MQRWGDELPGIERVLLTPEDIQNRVAAIGRQISTDYAGRAPALVGILKGVVFFLADLVRAIDLPLTVDFMAVSSYDGGQSSGVVRILKDLDQSIEDRHVLLVEDIIDTGLTLRYILRTLEARHPASLAVCTLMNRRSVRLIDIPLEYVGFDVPAEFLIGYGLDYQQRYRNIPFVAVFKPPVL
jgi:hypoxanthine phosphoribosyltransferase